MQKKERSLRETWDTIRYTNIYVIGVPEGRRDNGEKKLF